MIAHLAIITGATVAAALGSVLLRGSNEPLGAPVTGVAPEGVQLGGDEARLIAWDRVKRVEGEFAEQAAGFAQLSENAWRARIRLARGDTPLATSLFETLFAEYESLDGPTALLIAEGTARCRLASGEVAQATAPWLRAIEQRRAGWKIAGDPPIRALLDPQTSLIPGLPPIGFEGPVEVPADLADPIARRLAELYAGTDAPTGESEVESHEGVTLVRQMILARDPQPDVRSGARAWLDAEASRSEGSWREAWCRAARGQSLVEESDPVLTRAGMLELMHLPARFARSQPYLAGWALGETGQAMVRSGDLNQARKIERELALRFPSHPARAQLTKVINARTDPESSG